MDIKEISVSFFFKILFIGERERMHAHASMEGGRRREIPKQTLVENGALDPMTLRS